VPDDNTIWGFKNLSGTEVMPQVFETFDTSLGRSQPPFPLPSDSATGFLNGLHQKKLPSNQSNIPR